MKITIQSLCKAFGGRDVFRDFSLEIDSGVRLCVCGPNGSGKSTFLRMLAGEEPVDSGRIIYPRGCRVGYVQQVLDEQVLDTTLLAWVMDVLPAWHDFWTEWEQAVAAEDSGALERLSARQTELEAQYGYNPEHQARAVLSGLGFTESKWALPIRQLSGGWRERANLARVLVAGADVLLLDEPTNHLDIEAVEWLEEFLLAYKGALVFVAHDRVFMDHVGSHILYLGGQRPLFRKATFSEFVVLQAELEEQREREAQRISAEIERKMDFVRRFGAKATKARQAGSRQKMAKKLEKELDGYRAAPKRKELSFKWPEAPHSDKTVLSVAGLDFAFEDGTRLWPPLTFSLYRGQRVALVGPNGCGKSTLLKLITGSIPRRGGSLVMGSLVRVGYYSQHQTEILNISGTVLGEIRRLSDPRTTEEELMSVLGLFLLGQDYFDREISALSGGERSRLVLATLFLRRCNFLVLDEPTNHLDLESREALVEALDAFDGTLLLVAHDRYLLSEVIDEAWAVSHTGITVYKDGFEAYDTARRAELSVKRLTEVSSQETQAASGAVLSREELKKIKREQAEQRNALYRQIKPKQEAYKQLEAKLEQLLTEQSDIERQLADPEVYADSARTTALLKSFGEVKDQSEKLLEEMGELEVQIADLERRRSAFTLAE